MSQRLRPLIFSLLFLFVSVGAFQATTHYLSPSQADSQGPAGLWQQYVLVDGQPVYLATFTFVPNGSDFAVQAEDVAPCTFPQSDFRTFDHRFSQGQWSFSSDWHEYGIARFELKETVKDHFEGYAYLDGEQRPHRHILVKIKQ